MQIILLLILAVFHVVMTDYLMTNPDFYQLSPYTWESDEFRALKLGECVAEMEPVDGGGRDIHDTCGAGAEPPFRRKALSVLVCRHRNLLRRDRGSAGYDYPAIRT